MSRDYGYVDGDYIKSIEAGIDNVDTSISSMSMTYGHSATESLVAILDETERSTGLDITLLEEISAYFREVRKKYAAFEEVCEASTLDSSGSGTWWHVD